MNTSGKEIEAKFLLPGLADLRIRLLSAGGRVIEPRGLELNLRFDDSAGRLTAGGKVLRLRSGRTCSLTFKAPGPTPEERLELELPIDSLPVGRQLLESLGYRVVAAYEKYRETFVLGDEQVMLDELPFGSFAEIEAESVLRLRATAGVLDLPWARRLSVSYLDLFHALRPLLGLTTFEATFAAFEGLPRLPLADLEALAQRTDSLEAAPR